MKKVTPFYSGSRDDLMVIALDSKSRGSGSSPGQSAALYSWAKMFTLVTVPLFTQVYNINGSGQCNARGNPIMD